VTKTKKPVIALDIDDCLARMAERIVEYGNKHWGHSLDADEYVEDWITMWDVGHDELQKRIDKMFFDEELYPALEKINGAGDALAELGKKYRFVVLTARSEMLLKDVTYKWLGDNYPGLIDEVHFFGKWRCVKGWDANKTKADMCVEIGAEYMIDDQPKHANGAAERGVRALLFGDYGWNRAADVHEAVVRVRDWDEVIDYFRKKEGWNE
jgi:5'(3')-deoxyribonucleotidase